MSRIINLRCPIGYTGYGISALNILKQLKQQGVGIALEMIGNGSIETEEEKNLLDVAINNFMQGPYKDIPFLNIWHQNQLTGRIGTGKYCAFPFFELDTFSPIEKCSIRHPDTVFSTSKWAAGIVEQYRQDKSPVIPLGIDPSIFEYHPTEPSRTFNILNVGKWEVRKGHDIMVEIFERAFNSSDSVELWMMPHNPFLNPQQVADWESGYRHSRLSEKIWILPREATHAALANKMRQATIGLFPSRAEGFNLELLEMLALGKHVIATNYSAHTEYCNAENAHLIDIDSKVMAYDGVWFNGQVGKWAHIGETQIEQCVEHLRALYYKWKADPLGMVNFPGIQTGKQYTWQSTTEKVIENVFN